MEKFPIKGPGDDSISVSAVSTNATLETRGPFETAEDFTVNWFRERHLSLDTAINNLKNLFGRGDKVNPSSWTEEEKILGRESAIVYLYCDENKDNKFFIDNIVGDDSEFARFNLSNSLKRIDDVTYRRAQNVLSVTDYLDREHPGNYPVFGLSNEEKRFSVVEEEPFSSLREKLSKTIRRIFS
ncbi:MAG TPA: hypothetical protein P5274_01805 [Candidatus Paceibacterota bacterium]|nr:hypothetical protein [Candidatus Paceibacterota bacterium]